MGNNAVTVMEGQEGFLNPSGARFKHRVRAHVPGPASVLRAASR